jgi:catechol 2,3-dioxygenase-like lactoylglutathione lyase family enzyme
MENEQMIDHIGLRTQNLAALSRFYQAALKPLGWSLLAEFDGGAGFGDENGPVLWLGASDAASSVHLALAVKSRDAVDRFYAAALAAGGADNGKPGLRGYAPNYYAAFVIDPDGNNLEALCHQP